MKAGIFIILSLSFILFSNAKNAGGIPSDLDSTKDISTLSIIIIEEPPKDSVKDSARSKPASTKTMGRIMKKTEYLFIND